MAGRDASTERRHSSTCRLGALLRKLTSGSISQPLHQSTGRRASTSVAAAAKRRARAAARRMVCRRGGLQTSRAGTGQQRARAGCGAACQPGEVWPTGRLHRVGHRGADRREGVASRPLVARGLALRPSCCCPRPPRRARANPTSVPTRLLSTGGACDAISPVVGAAAGASTLGWGRAEGRARLAPGCKRAWGVEGSRVQADERATNRGQFAVIQLTPGYLRRVEQPR